MAVFLQGCDLACLSCHNPETRGTCVSCGTCIPACPAGALARGPRHDSRLCRDCGTCEAACPTDASPRTMHLSPDALLARVLPWVPFLHGLTFTGGEATLQEAFLLESTRLLKAHTSWTVLVDTHGDLPPGRLDRLAAHVDGFLVDIKALDPETHHRLTGRGPERVRATLLQAHALGRLTEVRTVILPGFSDGPAFLDALCDLMEGLDAPLRLTGFRRHGVRGAGRALPEPDPRHLEAFAARARLRLGDRVHLTTASEAP